MSVLADVFNVAIKVCSLQEDKSAKVIRLSDLDHDDENLLHLNLYENHFSFISKFQCTICTRLTGKPQHLNRQCQVEIKEIFKGKACLSKLVTYIGQLTLLGFNSQKYDVPLIRHYLASSLIKQDSTPKQVIKKLGGYP